MSLIDADAFEMDVQKCVMFGNTAFIDKYEVLFRLHNAPTIDAVPVVRCKDCQNWEHLLADDGYCYCPFVDHYTADNWFCADGERKDNADE